MAAGRGLSGSFMDALMFDTGLGLNRILQAVTSDDTLCLEIRQNYTNIYYRGGNLIRLREIRGVYNAVFDRKYILDPQNTRLPAQIGKQELLEYGDVTQWVEAIPLIKHEMDRWFNRRPKDEREFQQVLVRENNFSATAKGTDYFICDIEYASRLGRFDLIAVYWPSSGHRRKVNRDLDLAFIEMKYADKSLKGRSGIRDHIDQMAKYYQRNNDNFAALKREMVTVFNQKLELGLIDNQKPIESFSDKVPDFILILANHDPDSRRLIQEINEIEPRAASLPFAMKFAVSNFMGYGLYQQNIFGLGEFTTRFKNQIYSN